MGRDCLAAAEVQFSLFFSHTVFSPMHVTCDQSGEERSDKTKKREAVKPFHQCPLLPFTLIVSLPASVDPQGLTKHLVPPQPHPSLDPPRPSSMLHSGPPPSFTGLNDRHLFNSG